MEARRFTTTRLSGLRSAGRLQEMLHATISGSLEEALGSEYGRLFADFEVESSDVRAWYADGSPRPLAALPEADAEVLRLLVAAMIDRIGEHAVTIAEESTQKAALARILTAATTFPVEDIWADGPQPIIVNWGFHRHDVETGVPRPIRERIGRARGARGGQPQPSAYRAPPLVQAPPAPQAAPAAAPSIAPAAVARRARPQTHGGALAALLWLLFVGLAGTAYTLLLPACGIAGPGWLGHMLDACPARRNDAAAFAEGAELQQRVDEAELRSRRDEALCRMPKSAAASLASPAPPAAR